MGKSHTFKIKTLTNRITFEAYLKQTPKPGIIKSCKTYLDSLEPNNIGALLSSHGLSTNIYQCDDIEMLLSVYEELKQDAKALAQAANKKGNKAARSALAWLIKHLLEINNGILD